MDEYLILSVKFITGKIPQENIFLVFLFILWKIVPFGNLKQANVSDTSTFSKGNWLEIIGIFNFIYRIYNKKNSQENTYFLYFYSSYENKDCKRMICYPEIRSTWKIIIKYHSKEWKGRGKKELSSDRTEDRIGRGERRGKGWIPPLVNGGIRRIQTYSSWIWRLAV